jgi:hypothetical protein
VTRVGLEKPPQLTARSALFGGIEYDTNTDADWDVGLSWTLGRHIGLAAQYDSDHGFGVGVTLSL